MIYLFITIGLTPYWQTLSGSEVQVWFSGPFTGFSFLMVPLHLLSMAIMLVAVIYNWYRDLSLWLLAAIALFVCQGFNIFLHNAILNPALQSGMLSQHEALITFDNWDIYHRMRTIAALISMAILMIISMRRH